MGTACDFAKQEDISEPESVSEAESVVETESVSETESVVETESVSEAESIVETESISEPEIVAESEKDLSGEYYNPIDGVDATTLSIRNNGDGTYAVDLVIFRLTSLEDCVGKYQDGIFTFTDTDAAGNSITWQITDAGDHLVATVVDSTWEYLANQSAYEFYPIP